MRPLITLLVVLCCVMPAFTQEQAGETPAGPGLVGYWPFEAADGMVLLDASGRGHEGQIINEGRGVKRVPGRSGHGLEFTAGDPAQRGQDGAAVLPGLGARDWSRGLTVELWVKLNQFERPNTYELVSNTKNDRGPGWRLMITWESLCLRTGDGEQTWGAGSKPSLTALQAGQWFHLAGTYDGSVFRVYVDGLLAGESEPGLKLPPGDPDLSVGSYRAGYAYGLSGIIDELKLYDVARTPAEIMRDARLGR